VPVIADGVDQGRDVCKCLACGADAVMGSPASKAPGLGYHWGMATPSPVPRGMDPGWDHRNLRTNLRGLPSSTEPTTSWEPYKLVWVPWVLRIFERCSKLKSLCLPVDRGVRFTKAQQLGMGK